MKEGYSNEKELEEELEHFGAQMRKYLAVALILFLVVSIGSAYLLFYSPWSKLPTQPTEQPKQDTTAKTKPPTAFIKQDTIVFDLERIGELDKVDTFILEGIETLEERLNNELEIK